MKSFARLAALAIIFASTLAFAAGLDGNYTFVSRIRAGAPDLVGWTGTMKIKGDTMDREFKSKDGTESKFYVSELRKVEGDLYISKFVKVYKPQHLGRELKNTIKLTGGTLVIEAPDGSFKEVWKKK